MLYRPQKNTVLIVLVLICGVSCKKTDPAIPLGVLKHWDIALNTKFEVPGIAARTDTGTISIDLYSDDALQYTLHVPNLSATDVLQSAYIQVGDPLTNGVVILDLAPIVSGNTATGKIIIGQSLFDSLKYAKTDFYINITTAKSATGLLRGQFENPVIFSADTPMAGGNEVPAAGTTASGLAYLRITADKYLYFKINISSLETGDTLTFSHLHAGQPGTIGNVILQLCSTAADFGKVLKVLSSDDNLADLRAGNVYVNAHSVNHPAGLVRGQVRN